MNKKNLIGILLAILIIIIVVLCIKKDSTVSHPEYGKIMEYALGDDWKEYVSYSDKYDGIALYTLKGYIDIVSLVQKFNEYLDNNPSYYLNDNYKIHISVDLNKKKRYTAIDLRNYEIGSDLVCDHVYVAKIWDWLMTSELLHINNTYSCIDCVEVTGSELSKYYEDILIRFPDAKKLITNSRDDFLNERIMKYALDLERDIVIEYQDF